MHALFRYMASVWVPPVLAALSCIFSTIAWRRRKESGFLLLAVGFGVSALLSFTIVAVTSSGRDVAMPSTVLMMRFLGWIGPALILWGCWRLAAKKANKAPEPTTMAVTIRAPSSTARASHGRGSS
jgi:hypothetical protein